MKRIMSLILVFSVLLCSCSAKEQGSPVTDGISEHEVNSTVTGFEVSGSAIEKESDEMDEKQELAFTMESKNESILSEKVDSSKKAVEFFHELDFVTGITKGDDGNIYYFRCQKEGGNKKIIFYKNNGVEVCSAMIPKKYAEECFIMAFAKYGGKFWIEFDSDAGDDYVPLQIKDGKWGKEITIDISWGRTILYEDSFYHFDVDNRTVAIIDMKGNRRNFALANEGVTAIGQTIVDDKLYYIEEEPHYEKVMRCNLDGSGKEELFRYFGDYYPNEEDCILTLDGNYLYLHRPYRNDALTRIPLYGGDVQVVATATDWYDLSEDSIYYVDKTGTICKIDKELAGEPKAVTKISVRPTREIPFLYADRHLLVEGYNAEERKKINVIWAWEEVLEVLFNISRNYANECYWVTEDGKVEDTIPGTGLSEGYYELYKDTLRDMEKYMEEYEYIEDEYYTSE